MGRDYTEERLQYTKKGLYKKKTTQKRTKQEGLYYSKGGLYEEETTWGGII